MILFLFVKSGSVMSYKGGKFCCKARCSESQARCHSLSFHQLPRKIIFILLICSCSARLLILIAKISYIKRLPFLELHSLLASKKDWLAQMLATISRCDKGFNPGKAFICSCHFEEKIVLFIVSFVTAWTSTRQYSCKYINDVSHGQLLK